MLDRRQFGKTAASALAGGLFAIHSERAGSRILGANEDVRVAVVGIRGRGGSLIGSTRRSKGARLVALCDVDRKVLARVQGKDESLLRVTNSDELLARDDIDVIASATPNHWHALLTAQACMAGKHVYIEKPISHDLEESRLVVRAARKSGRMVQCGFQNRSDEALRWFYEDLHEGRFGKVLAVHGTCHRRRRSIGKREQPLEVPEHIDYDRWVGPAADRPLMRPQFHYDWHWDFNTGNGDVGNQGPHEWDMMFWALGDPLSLPEEMRAAGNRFAWNDAGDTPNVMACSGRLGGVPIRFEVMDLAGGRRAPRGIGVGVLVYTEKGVFAGGRGGGRFHGNDGKVLNFRTRRNGEKPRSRDVLHMQNFIDAVHSGKRESLHSEAEVAAHSTSMSHVANLSYMLSKKANPEKLEAAFDHSVEDRDLVARLRESVFLHLMKAKRHEVTEPWRLGPKLTFDNDGQLFTGDHADAANARQFRAPRKGYEFPAM